ncbi:RNA polymerase sigma factor [Streptomyces collinus]
MSDADPFDQEGYVARPADDGQFARFFRRHKDEFLRYLVSKTRTLADADEVLMDAAVRMYQRWEYIENHESPIAIAWQIVRSKQVDHYRMQVRRAGKELLTDDVPAFASHGGSVDELLALRGYERLDKALSALETAAPTQALCIRLRYLEELTTAEIAKRTDRTENAVRANICKGLRRLHTLMELPDTEEGDR